ncbi:hypothetical protein GWK47_008294 [Chionoecetes opilio]|uniref:Uncharacterized protein n=1 Tax=Chionoecetes opilio TaxID=41210 RepID=A0A8J4Y8X9_CHIOP|nr:hypothetical protein GWK47_008294 [Chionoecetes opilio]
MSLLERFVVLMYDPPVHHGSKNDARKQALAQFRALEPFPQRRLALQHTSSVISPGQLLNQILVQSRVTNPLLGLGQRMPLVAVLFGRHCKRHSKSCHELIPLGFKKGCTGHCKCEQAATSALHLCAVRETV